MTSFVLPVIPVSASKPLDNRLLPTKTTYPNLRHLSTSISRRPCLLSSISSPKRSPIHLATEAPVKEDLRQKLNNLLTRTPSTSTTETAPTRTKPTKIDPFRKYKVLLFNDESHSKDDVVRILINVVPELTKQQACNIMEMAHQTGMGVVGIWVFEISEAYCDLLRNNGLKSDIELE